jgi:hypothetical protein
MGKVNSLTNQFESVIVENSNSWFDVYLTLVGYNSILTYVASFRLLSSAQAYCFWQSDKVTIKYFNGDKEVHFG